MILAAAACAAAGISYIFNDDQQPNETKYETVTVSSTIVDKQGIVKYVIYPRMRNPYVFMKEEHKGTMSVINEFKFNRLILPRDSWKERRPADFTREFSVLFCWSMPLKARLLQTAAKPCWVVENRNPFKRNLMTISIGTQNGINENFGIHPTPSEIVLSNYNEYSYQTNQQRQLSVSHNDEYDDTLDSLSYNPLANDSITPTGILKKNKPDVHERGNNQKRFRSSNKISHIDDENRSRKMILNNVNVCVENLSKILSESCTNDEEQLTTFTNVSSIMSTMKNNNQQHVSSTDESCEKIIHSKLFQHDESLSSIQFHENSETTLIERLPDGVILHRGEQFGTSLGEPMTRKYDQNENLLINSSHSITELNRLLPKTNCLLLQQYHIKSIEDLVRLYLEQGQDNFTNLMIYQFKVDPLTTEQLTMILVKWTGELT